MACEVCFTYFYIDYNGPNRYSSISTYSWRLYLDIATDDIDSYKSSSEDIFKIPFNLLISFFSNLINIIKYDT